MRTITTSLCVGAVFFVLPALADPLMGNQGWQPRQESSRASIASLMLQQEQMQDPADSYAGAVFTCGGSGGGGTGGEGGGGGGDTTASSAMANNNCTIVVGSKGTVISADQISDGDQTASSDTNTTSNTSGNSGGTSLSSILESIE